MAGRVKRMVKGFKTRPAEKQKRSGEQGKGRHPGYSGGRKVESGTMRRQKRAVKFGL